MVKYKISLENINIENSLKLTAQLIVIFSLFVTLLFNTLIFIIERNTIPPIDKKPCFSSRIIYISYLDLEHLKDLDVLEKTLNTEIDEVKYTEGMRAFLEHTFDKNSFVEIAIIELSIDESVSDVHIMLNEYMHSDYNPSFSYRPDEINRMVLSVDEAIIKPCDLNLKTFKTNRTVALVLSITKPEEEKITFPINHIYLNNMQRVGISCHVDVENEIIGEIEYTYKNKKHREDIIEMKSASYEN